jgi:hypothetical protein
MRMGEFSQTDFQFGSICLVRFDFDNFLFGTDFNFFTDFIILFNFNLSW